MKPGWGTRNNKSTLPVPGGGAYLVFVGPGASLLMREAVTDRARVARYTGTSNVELDLVKRVLVKLHYSERLIAQSATQCQPQCQYLGCSLDSPPVSFLRTHRAILQSIEEELKPNVVAIKPASQPRTTKCPESALSTPCTKNAYNKQPRPPRCREEEQATGRPPGRQKKWCARNTGSWRSKESRAQGRSVGTVVAHFPTAVAVAKSKARVRKATRRAWE